MDNFSVSVQRFNEFAGEYAKRFMNIDSYIDSIDCFCDLKLNTTPSILELACGPGNITRYLKKRFPKSKIVAVDLAPNMIEIARETVPGADFMVMDVRNILQLSQKFDMIMCSFCLPFLSFADTSKLFTDCEAMLNPNGAFYISTMEGTESDAKFEPTSFSGNAEVFFNYYEQPELEKLFLTNNLQIKYTKRQNYQEPDGTSLTDMIFIGVKHG